MDPVVGRVMGFSENGDPFFRGFKSGNLFILPGAGYSLTSLLW